MITFSYRLKDRGGVAKRLSQMAGAVNLVWNCVNAAQRDAHRRQSARVVEKKDGSVAVSLNFLSVGELKDLVKGTSRDIGLHAQSIQGVVEEYVKKRVQAKKRFLRWRSRKKSLGWIPVKNQSIRVDGDAVIFMGRRLRFWMDRPVRGNVICASFSQDARGRWYVNVTTDHEDERRCGAGEVGVDLGLKTLATTSDGKKFGAARYFRRMERQLAKAQKDGKKRRAKAIHAKIRNSRTDLNHKISDELVRDNRLVVVGDVSASNLKKTSMAKSVSDAGWGQLRSMLKYKAIARHGTYVKVGEAFTSSTCSACGTRCPGGAPRGVKGLSIREWVCGNCGAAHDRDVNAALNILRLGLQPPGSEGTREPTSKSSS